MEFYFQYLKMAIVDTHLEIDCFNVEMSVFLSTFK